MITNKSVQKNYKQRNQKAQALTEGVIALGLIIFGVILGTLLLINAGVSTYYKEKLGFITSQAAQYAANNASDNTLQADTYKNVVKPLVVGLGLPDPGQSNVTVSVNTATPPVATVKVTLNNLALIPGTQFLPSAITSLTDTGVAVPGAASSGGGGSSNVAGYVIIGNQLSLINKITPGAFTGTQIMIPFSTFSPSIPANTPLLSLTGITAINSYTASPLGGGSFVYYGLGNTASGYAGNQSVPAIDAVASLSATPIGSATHPLLGGTFPSGITNANALPAVIQATQVGSTQPTASGNGSALPQLPAGQIFSGSGSLGGFGNP